MDQEFDDSVNLQMVNTWLDLLHGNSAGFIHVCASGQWEGFVTNKVSEAVSYVRTTDLRQPSGIYVRATTLSRKLAPGERGGNRDAACLPGLWADIDIAGPGHKTDKALVPDEDTAVELISRSPLPEPSIWVRSGGGLYPWWLLDEPRCIGAPDEMEDLLWLSATWQDLIAHTAQQMNFFYGTECKDLARVLRIPGTVNRKVTGNPKMCHIGMDLGGGDRYNIDQLYDVATKALPILAKPERVVLPARIVAPGAPDESPGDALESVPWDDPLLLGSDWQLHHQQSETCYWTRPGKHRRDGYSATTGYDPGRDRMFVFSSSTLLPVGEPLTKFAVHAHLHHGGDYAAAAGHLRKIGLGGREVVQVPMPDEFHPKPADSPPVEGKPIENTVSWSRFSWDDLGNGKRFAMRYGDRVRWLVDAEQWALYQNGVWAQVNESVVSALVQNLIDELPRLETSLYSDEIEVAGNGKPLPSEQEQFLAWVAKQHSDSRMRAMRSCATGRPELHVKLSDFDRDPMLLNCLNGVLDLKTLTLLSHDPNQLMMLQADAPWDQDAKCPEWMGFLGRAVPDPEARAYLQQITGYSLTGDVSERALFFHYGQGDNGKSVYLDVIGKVLNSYSIAVSSDTLMAKRFESNHNADVARMAGKRFLRSSETNAGKRLDEGQVKQLAGGDDTIVARFPYQRYPFEFRMTGKIQFSSNHWFDVSDSDSIWRRTRVFYWDVRVPKEEQEKNLSDRLFRQERAGILTWAVHGCMQWQQSGLQRPLVFELREIEQRDSMSVVGQFAEECLRPVKDNQEVFSRIYIAYQTWCQVNGMRAMTGKALSQALYERGYERWRSNSARGFKGIAVLGPLQSELDWRQQHQPGD
jgi:putative DNA primase/helicase